MAQAQTLKFILDGAANALSLNREATQVVIGGRSVYKIFNIEETEFVENCNLRVGPNLNLNFSCNDVAWNQTDDSLLATAATNGAVVIWNLMKSTRSKQEHVFNEHKRTCNKVCFKPSEPTVLLSGSQDGTMKLFDLRIRDVLRTFVSGSESVRDIQFSPYHTNQFTSVSETGNVQIWDNRRADRYFLQFTAHSGPIFACDWHSEMRWLATASRDKTIKVWDMEQKPTLEFTIHTLASIGHIKWRPGRRFHIASSSLVMDCSVNVWDVRRPYIPFATWDDHKDLPTGVAWRGPHECLTTSRDCSLVLNLFSRCKRPSDTANPQGISISGKGSILIASKSSQSPRKPRSEQFLHATSLVKTFFPSHNTEIESFIYCAKRYVLTGRSLPDLCDINSGVAREAQLPHVALVWQTLKVLYTYTPPTEENFFTRVDEMLLPESKNVTKVVSSCDASEEKSLRGLEVSGLDEEVELEESDLLVGLKPPEMQAQGDFFFGDGEMDPLSVDQTEALVKCQPDWTLKCEAFVARHEIVDGSIHETYGETIEGAPSTESNPTALSVHSLPVLPTFRFHQSVVQALWHHVHRGDVQTAVVVLVVLGERRRELEISSSAQCNWLLAYIDLLSRHQLFVQAAQIIQLAWLPDVSQLSQQSTMVYSVCGSCNKPLSKTGWLCERCKKTTVCSVCHQVVRGLLVWCQGCGHGGHVHHLKEWFRTDNLCPTGCGHCCEHDY